jgi:hypothetical protein
MSRSAGYAVTGNELQAMVNERILGLKAAIPQDDYCLTNAQVNNCVYVYSGDSPSGSFIPWVDLSSGGTFSYGPSPNYLANFSNINPVHATGSIVFELNQEGNPYLNADLFGYVNGALLRLDPGSNLDGMFFGGPQTSANMASAVRIGNLITVQANFGRNTIETAPSNWGWNGPGYGFLEVYANGILVHDYSVFKNASFSANLTEASYSFVVQAGVNYFIKAWSLLTYSYNESYSTTSANDACVHTLSNNCNGDL